MKDIKFVIWFKDFTGTWIKFKSKNLSMKSAEKKLSYVKKQFALNGQAGIFEAI